MNIIYLGCNGFPYGFAEVQKQKMISKALVHAGASVTIINAKGVFKKGRYPQIKGRGQIEGINYLYSSFSPYKPDSFFIRNFEKFTGKINEAFHIFSLRRRKEKNIAILSTQNIFSLIYYYYILKLAGYKIVLSYEEFVKNLKIDTNKKGLHLKFDDIAHKYCHALLPISKFLEDYQRKTDSEIPLFRIPALTDFDTIDTIAAQKKDENFILFCGASVYLENISFIIDAFGQIENQQIHLILIIHGSTAQNQKVFAYIDNSAKKDRIKVLSDLSSNELFRKYKQASLLLIPLKPYERDIARFPHKISEYTAAKTPIVTTAVGEINQYFTDNVNAFIAPHYDQKAFASKIDFSLLQPALSNEVAENAYQLGRMRFHYQSISTPLFTFLERI